MQRILIDTHVLIWFLSGSDRLGKQAKILIEDADNQIYVSAASTWEISIKKALGKLETPDDLNGIIEKEGFLPLPISLFHGEQAGLLPPHHKDPFDRMLIAQAQAEGLLLVTSDDNIPKYGIRTQDASA